MKFRQAKLRRSIGILFLSSLICCLWLRLPLIAQTEPSQLVQQGIALYQKGDYKGAIAVWQTVLNSYQSSKSANVAIIQENLARAAEQLGQSTLAVNYWEGAIAYYQQIGDRLSVAKLQTELAQSYNNQGQPRKAIALLCGEGETTNSQFAIRNLELTTHAPRATHHAPLFPDSQIICGKNSALEIARQSKDLTIEAAALGSLGNAYQSIGKYQQAIVLLQSSLKIAQVLNNLTYKIVSLNSLGNAYVHLAKINYRRANSALQQGDNAAADEFTNIAKQYDIAALKYFQFSLDLGRNDRSLRLQIVLNSIPVLQRTQNPTAAKIAIREAISLLNYLPNSRHQVYGAIALVNLLSSSHTGFSFQCGRSQQSPAAAIITTAIANAKKLQDTRALSFALGQLGHIYECRHNYQKALELTRQAQWAAQADLNSKDSLYLWQWQAGRIFGQQHQETKAIQLYQQAIETLESIRDDILTSDRDLQFDFRDTVEPIYRQLAALRLGQAILPSLSSKQRSQELNAALATIDSLQLAQLQNYFGNECVLPPTRTINYAQLETAVFSSIILDKRTAILISLPNGETKWTWIDRDRQSLKNATNEFRRGLERYRDLTYNPQQAQQFYDWIIRPFATDLEANHVKTLVFVHDGILRSIPMAALHDGKQFLVQKYAIATTPSLALTQPKSLNRKQLRVLALGVTQPANVGGRKFAALTHVAREIEAIATQMPATKKLLNENFTGDRLQQELSQASYPIVHIATHGEFSSEPENTFLLTGNNAKLTITQLDSTIRRAETSEAIDLIALTACQTAVGDERAALGLAGVAVQAGVSSALASLWFIQDASTVPLVSQFYEHLANSQLSKAAALQAAQQTAIASKGQYAHPAYWAGLIIIGNWL